MINVSNAFKQLLFDDKRNYLEYVDATLSDGTELHLENADLWQGGIEIEDAVSDSDSFDVGAAIINQCTIAIENLYERFSEYDFGNAEVVPYIGLELPDGSVERIRKGTFTVNNPKYNGSVITLECLDNMAKFDRPYSESSLPYPSSLNSIIRDACTVCDVPLQTYSIPHGDFIVQQKPSEESTTFREVIAWAAQIAGCFARCDTLGRLELKWFDQTLLEKSGLDGGIFDQGTPKYQSGDSADGGSFNPWDTGDSYDGGTFKEMENVHHIFSHYTSPVTSTDDVVITGVKVLEKTKDEENQDAIATYSTGGEGYWIVVENNDLIQGGNGIQICTWLGQQLIGLRFRKASLNHASDPTIEAGDVGVFTDRKNRSYPIVISYTKFSTGGSQNTESRAQDPIRNSAARFSAQTKNYVDFRKDIQQEKTDRQKALDELGKRIDSSGGLYTTVEIQQDKSRIFYLHNKPSLAESVIVWKMTAEAWGVSTDGGQSYNAGMTVDGDTIVRILTAVGINAEWIKTGKFEIFKNGKTMVLMDKDTGQVILRPDTFELSDGSTIGSIAKGEADNAVKNMSQTDVLSKLTRNGVDKGIYLENGKLYISFSAAKGDTLTLGGDNNNLGYVKLVSRGDNGIETDMLINAHCITAISSYTNDFIYGGLNFDRTGFHFIDYDHDNETIPPIGSSYISTDYDKKRILLKDCRAEDLHLQNMQRVTSGGHAVYAADESTLAYLISSSKRYKEIRDEVKPSDIESLYNVKIVWGKYKDGYLKNDDERNGVYMPMFIAEDVAEHFPIAVDHNQEGQPENWNDRVMIPAMFQMIKDLRKKCEDLETRIAALEKGVA